jgi:hypothetical protein
MLRKEVDRKKKEQLRADLQKQIQAKVFKRERERLYIDEKSLVTSGGILNKIGGLSKERHAEETTDMGKLNGFEKHIDAEVRHLQKIAQGM